MPALIENPLDPLARFKDGARIRGSDHPMPLLNTAIDVRIMGGLAVVRTERVFRNVEDSSIEATITFPVPVHATVVALSALIGARNLIGQAQRKQQARARYERAIDDGKVTVLHEEAIRGVHILSVGNIPPETEITVVNTWAMPLSCQGNNVWLRIPVTVGEIYGRSPLPDSDDLVHAPVVHEANLTVSTDEGFVSVRDVTLEGGRARVTLDRPIDVSVSGWVPSTLYGTSSDGRTVTLEINPAGQEDAEVNAALLLDQSGSMGEAAVGGRRHRALTKHDVMVDGLRQMLARQRTTDQIRLWQFDSECQPACSLNDLWGPRGGTEIGCALETVAASCPASDIVIITDGKSHHLDVQALARTGKRFTAILVGEDSLEAQIGHLAALTGGEIFVVSGVEAADAVIAALNAIRRPRRIQPPIEGSPTVVAGRIGGMGVTARWGTDLPQDAPVIDRATARYIGAVAAALAIPNMDAASALELAEAHNIVCHLTSLVLVDEAGDVTDSLPTQRRVPLMRPASFRPMLRESVHARRLCAPLFDACPESPVILENVAFSKVDLSHWVGRIDWSDAEALRQGKTKTLPAALKSLLAKAAREVDEVRALAQALGIKPIVVVIALLAKASADQNRNAARVFRAVLGSADPDQIEAASYAVGLRTSWLW